MEQVTVPAILVVVVFFFLLQFYNSIQSRSLRSKACVASAAIILVHIILASLSHHSSV